MADKKSLLFVHNGKGLGGAPKALRYIIETCKNYGHACYVACLDCHQTIPYFKEVGAQVIVVDSLPCYTNSTSLSLDLNSRAFQKEREFAAQYHPFWLNLLKEHGPFSLVFLNSMVLCDLIRPSKEYGCKVIQVIRETAKAGPSLTIMKDIFSEADAVLFISEYDQDLFSIDSTQSVVIPDAVEPALYSCSSEEKIVLKKEHGVRVEDVVLLFTGGVGYIKGGDLLIDILTRLNCSEPVTVFFAGYTSRKGFKYYVKSLFSIFSNSPRLIPERTTKKLIHLARTSQLNIRSIGFCPNIEDYYKMSDICIVPYRVPHQAMPIFESGMAKLPCLVSDFPCYQHEVRDGYNGYLLPINRPDAWAKKIEVLVGDRNERTRLGLNNYEFSIARHNINQNKNKWLNLIDRVLTV